MIEFLVMFFAVMGLFLDRELAEFVEFSASQVRFFLSGVLAGVGVGLISSGFGTRRTL